MHIYNSETFLSNMTSTKVVTGTKVITRIWNVDFVSVASFEVNDEKIISDEHVVNAITCDFPCKILKNFTVCKKIIKHLSSIKACISSTPAHD